jgi:hypothetical protein
MFPATFLDSEKIAEAAGDNVLSKIRTQALVWVASIVFLFTVMQLVVNFVVNFSRPDRPNMEITKKDLDALRDQMDTMQSRLLKFEQTNPPGPAAAERTPSPSPQTVPPN